jgi:predicted ATP-grasp superfamily ATP-dependent carboligase
MNVFYTGLGIARCLGEKGIPVIGLTSARGIYGNFTRYAKMMTCPDSREQPEALLAYLLQKREELAGGIIFPTRDDDLVFLDRFRDKLGRHFKLILPNSAVLNACLNKWETYRWARDAGVPTPKCWIAEQKQEVERILPEINFPCVLKPLSSHHWRRGRNWERVGARKAISVSSREELLAEYSLVAQADPRVVIQEMVPGGDDCLVIAAVYLDRQSAFVAGFNTRKLVQSPQTFGTGCIVQTADVAELFPRTIQLLNKMRFHGIAEVEYKWDALQKEYWLIEINPRPWDQHILGNACGTDLMYLAYCEHAGIPMPAMQKQPGVKKWIAEDAWLMAVLQSLWRRDGRVRRLLQLTRCERVYAIWSGKDPIPFWAYIVMRFLPHLLKSVLRVLWSAIKQAVVEKRRLRKGKTEYEPYLEASKSQS